MRLSLSSTSTRTFAVIPAVVLAEQLVSRRRVRQRYVFMLLWGYLQYRFAGNYRIKRAGGPSGMSQGFPERIVTEGIYEWTRNPMYLGHLIFIGGLTLATRSPLALSIFSFSLPWFARRVQKDEERLTEQFGQAYVEYVRRVPRWVGIPKTRMEARNEPEIGLLDYSSATG